MRAGLYARVSPHDQPTLSLQRDALRAYARQRGWSVARQIEDVGSEATERRLREELMELARRRRLDVILVWRLDRWGLSIADLVLTLQELNELGVGFVSLSEALDLTPPSSGTMVGLLAKFTEFEREIRRERVKTGIAQARKEGRPHGRPPTLGNQAERVREYSAQNLSQSEIARRLGIGRTSVRRILLGKEP